MGGWQPAAVPPVGHISHVAGHTLSRHPIDPLPWGVIGYQRQIDQTRLKIDAQPDLQYGVRAMWSERSRLRRLGTAPGSLGKVAVLAVRFLRRG